MTGPFGKRTDVGPRQGNAECAHSIDLESYVNNKSLACNKADENQ